MPTDPAPVDPKDEIQLSLCEEADVTWKPTDPKRQVAYTLRWVGMCAGIGVIKCLSARFNMWHANLERKKDTVTS